MSRSLAGATAARRGRGALRTGHIDAQFGGLKKKVKDKIAGDAQPASTTTATTTTARGDPSGKARRMRGRIPRPSLPRRSTDS